MKPNTRWRAGTFAASFRNAPVGLPSAASSTPGVLSGISSIRNALLLTRLAWNESSASHTGRPPDTWSSSCRVG
ncbi:Uncharacterised protein [Bordetella pertussis]|nr:Uncharacterised protein [Bordetella pertussis]